MLKTKEVEEIAQIEMAYSNLKKPMQTLNVTPSPNAADINSLEDIAVIRATLDALSTYLGDDFAANIERFKKLPECLKEVKRLCDNPDRSAIRLFLLKQLVRNDINGIDAVKERCKRKELEWIMPPQAKEVKPIFYFSNRLII